MKLLAAILNRAVSLPAGQILVCSLFAANKVLCFRLLRMAESDQKARKAALNGKPFDERVDRRHTRAMKEIVAKHGWPGEKLVGTLGAQAAWLLVQHADHDREFQKACHHLLEISVNKNDAQARHLAYLTDRICVGDEIPQIYGTQFDYPIADLQHVDERRAAVGLSSLAEYLTESSAIRKMIKNDVPNPRI